MRETCQNIEEVFDHLVRLKLQKVVYYTPTRYQTNKKKNTYVYKQHTKPYVSLKLKSILLKYFEWIYNKKFLIIINIYVYEQKSIYL